jgi:hypothetical protein
MESKLLDCPGRSVAPREPLRAREGFLPPVERYVDCILNDPVAQCRGLTRAGGREAEGGYRECCKRNNGERAHEVLSSGIAGCRFRHSKERYGGRKIKVRFIWNCLFFPGEVSSKRKSANILAGILTDFPNLVPSSVSFRSYHLKHHSFQGDYDLDADLPSR